MKVRKEGGAALRRDEGVCELSLKQTLMVCLRRWSHLDLVPDPCPYVDNVFISHSYSNESCMVLLVPIADLIGHQDGSQGFLLCLHVVSIW